MSQDNVHHVTNQCSFHSVLDRTNCRPCASNSGVDYPKCCQYGVTSRLRLGNAALVQAGANPAAVTDHVAAAVDLTEGI
jgi:hypothetical protein